VQSAAPDCHGSPTDAVATGMSANADCAGHERQNSAVATSVCLVTCLYPSSYAGDMRAPSDKVIVHLIVAIRFRREPDPPVHGCE